MVYDDEKPRRGLWQEIKYVFKHWKVDDEAGYNNFWLTLFMILFMVIFL